MHEWFTAKDPEEGIPHCFGFINQPIHGFHFNLALLGGNIYPASLTSQITAIDDGYVEKWWKEVPTLEAFLMLLHAADSLESCFPGQVPKQSLVCSEQQSFGHFEIHEHPTMFGGLSRFAAIAVASLSIDVLDDAVIVVDDIYTHTVHRKFTRSSALRSTIG